MQPGENPNLKVLLVTGCVPERTCGVGDYTVALARHLAAMPGVRVGILAGNTLPADRCGSVECLPPLKGWSLRSLPAFVRAVRSWKPDIVHLQHPSQAFEHQVLPTLLPILVLLTGARLVRTWHEFWTPRQLRHPRLALELLGNVLPLGEVVVVRPTYRDQLARPISALIGRAKVSFIPNASVIEPAEFGSEGREAYRARLVGTGERLLVHFGFLYPHKRAELLFSIGDPQRDRIVFAGQIDEASDHVQSLLSIAHAPPWSGRVTMTGYLSAEESARILAAADVVVLPFKEGAGIWNSSLHAAMAQGTPVLTTTTADEPRFDEERSVYYARVDDLADMRRALDDLTSRERRSGQSSLGAWRDIITQHLALYRRVMRDVKPGRDDD